MQLSIIKIGGNIIDDEAKLLAFLDAFAAVQGKKILVHGGGKLATRVAEGLILIGARQDLASLSRTSFARRLARSQSTPMPRFFHEWRTT